MSTRCLVGQKREDGIHSFYCHHDGYRDYPYGVGSVLARFYDTEELATKLVDLCEPYGTSSIENSLKETKLSLYKNDPYDIPVYRNKAEYVKNAGCDIEYIYLWDKGEWKMFNLYAPTSEWELGEEVRRVKIENGRFKPLASYKNVFGYPKEK